MRDGPSAFEAVSSFRRIRLHDLSNRSVSGMAGEDLPDPVSETQAFACLRLRYITSAAPKPSAMRSVTTGAGSGAPMVPL